VVYRLGNQSIIDIAPHMELHARECSTSATCYLVKFLKFVPCCLSSLQNGLVLLLSINVKALSLIEPIAEMVFKTIKCWCKYSFFKAFAANAHVQE